MFDDIKLVFQRITVWNLIMILVFCSKAAFSAGDVDENTIRLVAENWYRHYAPKEQKEAAMIKSVPYRYNGKVCFYICSFNKEGFVLVSATESAPPVLAYGFDSQVPDTLDLESVTGWFDGYAMQIGSLPADASNPEYIEVWDDLKNNIFPGENRDAILPLLTSTWDQAWPYNARCPEHLNGPGGHCVAGCVATALGQIMKYHEYPPVGYSYHQYTDKQGHEIELLFDTLNFQWDQMPDALSQLDTAYAETARLLYAAGVASTMDYSAFSSGALDITPLSFIVFFGYAYDGIRTCKKADYSQADWDALLIGELQQGRPVYYEGYQEYSLGHAWVCDGYDGAGYFHFNFGWGGSANGYYLTDCINPLWFQFNDRQSMIIGIRPNDGSTVLNDTIFSGTCNITRPLCINPGFNATVQPGTVMNFDSSCNMLVLGGLQAVGTPAQPISFTASDTTERWGGLAFSTPLFRLRAGMEIDSCLIQHSVISYAQGNGITNGPVHPNIDFTPFAGLLERGLHLRHCQLMHNIPYALSTVNHAGVYLDSCEIAFNQGGLHGLLGWAHVNGSWVHHNQLYGGIYLEAVPRRSSIRSSLIEYNVYSSMHGLHSGGICIAGGPADVIGNVMRYNETMASGGGFTMESAGGIIADNLIHDNSAYFYGGAGMLTSGTMMNNVVYNNYAGYYGGALYLMGGATVINNLFYNNSSNSTFELSGFASVRMDNNTVVNNVGRTIQAMYGGGISGRNNIFWNTGLEFYATGGTINFDNCIVKGGMEGVYFGNRNCSASEIRDRDPLFVNPTGFSGTGTIPEDIDWGLRIQSPAIDAAVIDTAGMNFPMVDCAGLPRFNREMDLGALENQSDTLYPAFISCGLSRKICEGDSTFLTMRSRGEQPGFQWYKGNTVLAGQTSDTLFIHQATLADSAQYACEISNHFGLSVSDTCLISVYRHDTTGFLFQANGPDTIYHFQYQIPFHSSVHPAFGTFSWETGPGLSISSYLNDTTILISVDEIIDSAYIRIIPEHPCLAPTVRWIKVDSIPPDAFITGHDTLCAAMSYPAWDKTFYINQYFRCDSAEWIVPPGIHYGWQGDEVYCHDRIQVNYIDSLNTLDTLYARWKKNDYGVGNWTPFVLRSLPPVLAPPAEISGPDQVNPLSVISFQVDTVPHATAYFWELPPGFEILSGHGTASVQVNVTQEAISGFLSVRAINPCRESDDVQKLVFVAGDPVMRSWTGAVDENWHVAGNWNPHGIPDHNDEVVIPLDVPVMPEVKVQGMVCRKVILEPGASLNLHSGVAITIYGVDD